MNLDKIFINNLINLGAKFDYIYSLEIKGVLKGFKKIAKLEPFTLDNLNKLKDLFSKLGLKYIYFEKDGYFNEDKMLFIKGNNKKDIYIDIYISKSEKILNILEKLIKKGENNYEKNYLIGRLLGYPNCCIKSFLDVNYSSDLDFNKMIKQKTIGKFDWRLNNLINPYSLIPFFPCSYNCKEAIKYAENNLKIIGKKYEKKSIFSNVIEYNDFWNFNILSEKDKVGNNIFNFRNSLGKQLK